MWLLEHRWCVRESLGFWTSRSLSVGCASHRLVARPQRPIKCDSSVGFDSRVLLEARFSKEQWVCGTLPHASTSTPVDRHRTDDSASSHSKIPSLFRGGPICNLLLCALPFRPIDWCNRFLKLRSKPRCHVSLAVTSFRLRRQLSALLS